MQEKESPVPLDYFLQPGYIFAPLQPATISTVLGSCVAVALHDRKRKVGSMNHFLLPVTPNGEKATARHGTASTIALIRMMVEAGSQIKNLEAQIFGGGHNPEFGRENIGLQNIKVARKVLIQKGIRVVSEDIGGVLGRKVVFNTHKNEVVVLKVETLRRGDWHPYQVAR